MLRSFGVAFRGIWDVLKTERHMRVHLAAGCYVLWAAFRLSLSRGELAAVFAAIGGVMGTEAMNTAVEKLCDFEEKRENPHIRIIKDMAAGAVLLAALAAVGVGCAVFFRPETWALARETVTSPLRLVWLLLSLVLAGVFVLVPPAGNGQHR